MSQYPHHVCVVCDVVALEIGALFLSLAICGILSKECINPA